MKLRTLDLFAGIGGFSLGLERTGGFETVAFCEIDKAAQKVLKKHWPNVPIFEDVKSLSTKDIDGPIDVITGGFPCQDISIAGRGAGLAGERSGLWFEYSRLIEEAKPKWIIAENVSALRSRGLDQVLRSLSEIGYDAEWHCIPASAVGAPHRRDRIWIVAYPHGSLETDGGQRPVPSQEGNGWGNQPGGSGGNSREGCVRGSGKSISAPVVRTIQTDGFWKSESRPYGVVDGVPNRVDRIKQLGNAVVPQIPELIGRAILQYS